MPRPKLPARRSWSSKEDTLQLDIIDPVTLKIVGKAPVGQDPHEVIASADGKTAYISNYMGQQGPQHKLSVVDLVAQKAMPAIELGALQGPHGLDFQGGELYFTAETSKVIGRYDPATQKIDWVMGTGQDRTHMVWVAPSLDRIVTSNVSSATISILELVAQPNGGFGPPPGAPGGNGRCKRWTRPRWPAARRPRPRRKSEIVGNYEHPGRPWRRRFRDVSPDGKEIWTGNAQDNTVSIINVASKKNIRHRADFGRWSEPPQIFARRKARARFRFGHGRTRCRRDNGSAPTFRARRSNAQGSEAVESRRRIRRNPDGS